MIGIFAGTFDPFTLGHKEIVTKAIGVFSEIHIVIAINPSKKCMFSIDSRKKVIEQSFQNDSRIKIVYWEGLIVDYCKEVGSKHIIRGLRGATDFGYENMIYHANQLVNPEIETIYFMTSGNYIGISSSGVRELVKNKHYQELARFMCPEVDLNLLKINE